jgi:preprotein translocase subunit SecA
MAPASLHRFRPLLAAVAAREPGLAELADSDLRARAAALRAAVSDLEPAAIPDERLADAFALVRETSRRALGLRPYDVQVAAGLALHQGRVVEMATGEGKTLAAVAPVFLAALAGRGAHVLTFNDYLARRDAAWMGPIYERLGLSAGCVQEGMAAAARRCAYGCDVTYLTAKEVGFDLLRDGLCLERAEQVRRPFHFALVDEADSILIDEARIPLVIAGALESEEVGLGRLADLARRLEPGVDYDTDEHRHNVFLTEAGAERTEALLGHGALFTAESVNLLAAVRNAIHAEHLLTRDVDYIVRRGAVELVDELTGRVAENRQWPDGLQAAVEAKEGLRLGSDGVLLGSITLQHLLRLYPRLAGMTATARPAARELRDLYGVEVETIPSNRPCVRVDDADRIYTHRGARDRAVEEEVARVHRAGRPILVGTASVADSEGLAARLRRAGILCRVLNAKNDEQEAEIVADAGALGAVTISTNMAGRGTDIKLGGRSAAEHDRVTALGGLYVLGTNRHESRRIDDQLRGRAGRQGDPGSSRFFLSLDDDLLRRYGIDRLLAATPIPVGEEAPIDSGVVRREVDRAQRIAEGECFDVRMRLHDYSQILETQRQYVQEWRQEVLEGAAEGGLLERRRPERWRELAGCLKAGVLLEVERRLTLLAIDGCWSDYLTEMQTLRDEIHLVSLDGRQPIAEFFRTAIGAFDTLVEHIEETAAEAFERLKVTADGADWDTAALRRPAATWTYLVSDHVFGGNLLHTMATRASFGFMGVLVLWPVLIAWGLYVRWRRRRGPATDRGRGGDVVP